MSVSECLCAILGHSLTLVPQRKIVVLPLLRAVVVQSQMGWVGLCHLGVSAPTTQSLCFVSIANVHIANVLVCGTHTTGTPLLMLQRVCAYEQELE